MALPDFLIIGAMKCGTSTLQAQLVAQPGVFMTTPKEPNFFSDDPIYARGLQWYEALYEDAPEGALKGEASTHYTKLPTYPHCADRLVETIPDARLIYLVRDPFARLVSHYIHEWTMGVMEGSLDAAIERHPELVSYSRYGMQIAPYVERYGADRILVLRLEDMNAAPQETLERTWRFLGMPGAPVWREDSAKVNVSAERLRRIPLGGLLVDNPVAGALRRALVPKAWREAVKRRLRMETRPDIPEATRARLAPVFEEDRAVLENFFPELAARRAGAPSGSATVEVAPIA
jgi:hypothetical protein